MGNTARLKADQSDRSSSSLGSENCSLSAVGRHPDGVLKRTVAVKLQR